MTIDFFWELLSKKLTGEASEAELMQLNDFLCTNPEWKRIEESFSLLWQQSLPFETTQAHEAFEKHLEQMRKAGVEVNDLSNAHTIELPSNKKSFLKKWWLPLSSVAALFLIFLFIKNSFSSSVPAVEKTSTISQVVTKPGSRTELQLPDGSTVMLNASSNLSYDKTFGKRLREVTLTGEAYFDVVKDPSHPFIIHTKVIDIKILGTQLNVKAYPDDAVTETSLIRGSVQLTVKNKQKKTYYLKPDQKMVVPNSVIEDEIEKKDQPEPIFSAENLSYAKTDNSIIETSWVEDKLILQQNETFSEVAVKMERWYGVHFHFTSEKVAKYRPFATFTTETINQALEALKEGLPKFNYKIEGNNVTITE